MAKDPLYEIALSMQLHTKVRKQLAMVEQYGSAEAAWHALEEAGKPETLERAKRELEWIEKHGIRVWTSDDPDYPYRLRQCIDRPPVLYGKGNLNLSDGHFVSIVGTRRASERGKELTTKLVQELHEQLEQVTIVSGGAYGIDIAAHRAAMDCGIQTIIVPAHGLDRIYPQVHRPDAVRALGNGGLLTEFPSGTDPLALYFLQRNRIVAGLADAVVVVESRERGGSLSTAHMARDYDRELFAFPGRPSDPSSIGCNNLIRANKAQLIDNAEDLIKAMGWTTRNAPQQSRQMRMVGLYDHLSQEQQELMQILQTAEDGMHINLLVMQTEREYSEISSDLMMLEIEGLVKSLPGGFYKTTSL